MEQTAIRTSAADDALAQVAGRKIFFGHQSVGANIIEGIQDLSRDVPSPRLNLVETSDPSAFDRPVFAHAKVGENSRPASKLADFERMIDAGIGERADAVLLKFCYIDITAKTDVEALFRSYEATMSRIRQRYPKLTIVHVTAPLRTVQKGLKARIKSMAGLAVGGAADNVKRNLYNALLYKRYQGKEPVFDLASIEATAPDGAAETFSMAGTTCLALYPPYTSDGGHLAAPGRARAARGLLTVLAALR